MSSIFEIAAIVLLLSTVSVVAQVATPAEPRTASQVLDFWVTNTEQLLVPAAAAMPEAKYSFAPSNGEFSGVRTFAEQVKHLAAANYQLAAATLGEEPPAGTDHETAPDTVKTKAQVMDYLKGSFRSLHRAAAALNEKNMDDPIPSKGSRTRLLLLIKQIKEPSTRSCNSCPGYHVVGYGNGGGTMRRERSLKVVLVLVGLIFCGLVYPLTMFVRQELGIFLLLASRNPSANRSLIAFTAWSSFVHAVLMAGQAFARLIARGVLIGSAVLVVIGVALIVLAPAKQTVQPEPNEPSFWWKSAPGFINLVVAWVQHQTAGSALLESPTVLQKKQ